MELYMPAKRTKPNHSLGEIGELVFDDEPLEPQLAGLQSSAPTPASVVEIWRQGIDRSGSCARAFIAVLARNRDATSHLGDLEDARKCIHAALENNLSMTEAENASCHLNLGRILFLNKNLDEAESYFQRALAIQERVLGVDHETTISTADEFIELLKANERKPEARRLRNLLQMRILVRANDRQRQTGLFDLRRLALEMFLAGQYAEAESIYRRILELDFEPASNRCHLARVFLMTGREVEARQFVEEAEKSQRDAADYVSGRIQFLRVLLHTLAQEEWRGELAKLKPLVEDAGTHLEWTMQPVLDHLRPRLGNEMHTLLRLILDVLSDTVKVEKLDADPTWKAICGNGK
jgi:tetratricopeptide (TPR) repeat protein